MVVVSDNVPLDDVDPMSVVNGAEVGVLTEPVVAEKPLGVNPALVLVRLKPVPAVVADPVLELPWLTPVA